MDTSEMVVRLVNGWWLMVVLCLGTLVIIIGGFGEARDTRDKRERCQFYLAASTATLLLLAILAMVIRAERFGPHLWMGVGLVVVSTLSLVVFSQMLGSDEWRDLGSIVVSAALWTNSYAVLRMSEDPPLIVSVIGQLCSVLGFGLFATGVIQVVRRAKREGQRLP